jgi:cytochrome c oxidase subunit IV
MPPRLLRLLLAWVLLLVLLGIEFGASFLPLAPWSRVLILLPALAMAAIVGIVFMEVGRGPVVARGFAAAGLFWLVVLLGLGSMDPLTRTDYHTTVVHPE